MFKEISLIVLTKAINKIIQSDPFASGYLADLQDKSLRIIVQKVGLDLLVRFKTDSIAITSFEPEDAATVTISGSPSKLLAFAKSHEHTRLLMEKNVKIEGSLEVLLDIKKFQEQLDIDWEAFFSEYMGDFAANRLLQVGQLVGNQLRYNLKRTRDNIADYVRHETTLLVQRREMDEFSQSVLNLRRNLDRLDARIKLIENRHKH